MRSVRVVAVVLLSVSACLGADQWTRVQSKNFTLVGSAKEKTIRQVGAKLEQFRAAFGTLTSEATTASPIPTVVIVFKDDKAFEPFKPIHDLKTTPVAGYFQGGEEINYILLSPDSGGDNPYRVIFHEYVHSIIHTQALELPIWLNEGLAEYYSTFEIEGNSRKVWIGRIIPDHVLLLRETFLPVSAILGASQDSFARDETTRRGLYYAASWALTHYLLLGDNQRYRKGMEKYLSTIEAESEDPEQEFLNAIGVGLKEIDKGLEAYVHQDTHPVQIYTLAEKLNYEQQMTSSPMSESEAAYYLGDALLHSRRMNEAESYLRRALAIDPDNADAKASFGIMRLRQDRTAEAKAALEKAVANPSVKPIAHYYYARALLHDGGAGELSGETSQTALTHLKKALELMPHYAPAYDLLAFVNLASDQGIDESIRLVETGIRLAPRQTGFLLTLAQLQMRKHDWVAARQTLNTVLARKADERVKRLASDLLEETARQEESERRRQEQRRLDEAEAARILARQARMETDSVGDPQTSAEVPAVEPDKLAPSRPQCRPGWVNIDDRRSMSGTLTAIAPAGEGLAFTLTTKQGRFIFFAPDRNAPLIYSCTVKLGGQFDYSKVHHAAIVYFDAAPAGGRYAGRLVAVDILSTKPE